MLKWLQQIGKSLMLPIATLPVAAILLRLGVFITDDLHATGLFAQFGSVILSSGNALFSNLGFIFAVGVAIGFAKDQHGSAALAGVVGFLVMFAVMGTVYKISGQAPKLAGMDPATATTPADALARQAAQITGYSIPGLGMGSFGGSTVLPGITIGIIAGAVYNKFHDTRLPQALSFFGGRRLVPLLTSIIAIFVGFVFAFIMPPIQSGLTTFTHWMETVNPIGYGIFGFANRMLIPFGLHHVLNTFFWFTLGHCANDITIQGDINMFLKHCQSATGFQTPGAYQTGFFPIMMFGLPAAAIAMANAARPEKRSEIMGMMLGVGAVSFITGVTEPIEFSFIFVAPRLFFVHGLLTGLSLLVCNALGIYDGFGFSAGLFDFLLNFSIATKPLLLLGIGVIFAVVYYFIFYFSIVKFNIKTPGRDNDEEVSGYMNNKSTEDFVAGQDAKASTILKAIGGKANINEIGNCTTRLRLNLKDTDKVDEAAIKKLNFPGQIKVDKHAYQIIVGPDVEFLADEMRKLNK